MTNHESIRPSTNFQSLLSQDLSLLDQDLLTIGSDMCHFHHTFLSGDRMIHLPIDWNFSRNGPWFIFVVNSVKWLGFGTINLGNSCQPLASSWQMQPNMFLIEMCWILLLPALGPCTRQNRAISVRIYLRNLALKWANTYRLVMAMP